MMTVERWVCVAVNVYNCNANINYVFISFANIKFENSDKDGRNNGMIITTIVLLVCENLKLTTLETLQILVLGDNGNVQKFHKA